MRFRHSTEKLFVRGLRRELVVAVTLLAVCAAPGFCGESFVRYTMTGETRFDEVGRTLAALGDVDGDGSPDFAVTALQDRVGGHGQVLIVSGRDGEVIRTLENEEDTDFYGIQMGGGGDLDGDGVEDDYFEEGQIFTKPTIFT